ncbi:MAG: hypothetical protein V7709_11880 [Halioglobus sp.]
MPSASIPGQSGNGDMGQFPSGEFPGNSDQMPGEGDAAEGDSGAAGEPGFEDTAGTGSDGTGSEGEPGLGDAGDIPDMTDEPSLEDSIGAFEDAMGDSDIGIPGGSPEGQPTGNSPYGIPGYPGGGGTEEGEGSGGNGTLTPAEQVAILDAQLERGTGEFDAMILDEQAAQRRATREQASRPPTPSTASASENSGNPEGGMADSGGYSSGGGMPGAPLPGGAGGGTSNIPQNSAKYPAPTDIPSGTDDDVVARQLREAAMREPDPAIREKLWDEYRKYKGISS